MAITYQQNTENVNWEAMRQQLIHDNFHNGRSPEQYRVSFENSSALVIAYDDHKIIGTARMLSDQVCNAYIVDMWTHSAYRKQGVARYMLQLLEAKAEGQHISLWTSDAQRFYEQVGYKRSDDTLYEKVVGQWLHKPDQS